MISRGRASTAASLSCPHLITSTIKSACSCQISRCSRGAGKRGGAPEAPLATPGTPHTWDFSGWRISPHHHPQELPRCSKGKTIFPEHWEQLNPQIPSPASHPCWQCWMRLILEHTGHMAGDTGTACGLYGDRQPGFRGHLLRLH